MIAACGPVMPTLPVPLPVTVTPAVLATVSVPCCTLSVTLIGLAAASASVDGDRGAVRGGEDERRAREDRLRPRLGDDGWQVDVRDGDGDGGGGGVTRAVVRLVGERVCPGEAAGRGVGEGAVRTERDGAVGWNRATLTAVSPLPPSLASTPGALACKGTTGISAEVV